MIKKRKTLLLTSLIITLLHSFTVSAESLGVDFHNDWRTNTKIGWNYDLSGKNVIAVQSMMKKATFDPGTIDGMYGSKTHDAIMKYQSAFGLSADGIVGPNTFAKMQYQLVSVGERYITRPSTGETTKEISYVWIPNLPNSGISSFTSCPAYDYWVFIDDQGSNYTL